METYISFDESLLDDSKCIDHGPIFANDSNNVFAQFGFNAQNFLSNSYCWWTTYIVDGKQMQIVTLSLISSRYPSKGNFVKFLNALVMNIDMKINWLIIPWPSNRMIEVATKFGFVYECQQDEQLILDCNEWRKTQTRAAKGL